MQKYFFQSLILLAFVFLLGLTGFTLLLPKYIQTSLLPSLLRNAGIVHFQATRPLIGLNTADIGFVVGPPDKPVLSVASLNVLYSFADLLDKKIEEINVSGVEIHCALENNKLIVDDPSLQKLLAPTQNQSQGKTERKTKKTVLPFTAKHVSIRQATLILTMDDQLLRLPFEVQLLWPDSSPGSISLPEIKMSLYLRDQKVEVKGLLDENLEKLKLSISAANFDVQRFADFMNYPPGLEINSTLSLRANANIVLSPFTITDFAGTLNFADSTFFFRELLLSPHDKITQENSPLIFNFEGINKDQTWNIKASSSWPDILTEYSGKIINILSPSFQVTGNFAGGNTTFDTTARLGLEMADEIIEASVPTVTMESRVTGKKGQKLQLEGITKISQASFAHSSSGIHFENAFINLPIKLPLSDDASHGELSVPKIRRLDKELGNLRGKIEFNKERFALSTNFTSKFLPGLTASSSLISDIAKNRERKTQISVTVPPWKVSDFSLRQISPSLTTETLFSGIISGQANFTLGDEQKGKADITLSDGTLKIPEEKITISGMQTHISFPELPLLHSSPAQTFHFTSATFKDLSIKDSLITYTIESPDSFLVEQADFNWADGSIHTYALRLKEGASLPPIILYCNKLRLTSILSQLGIEQTSGEGTVNGRIPVTVTDGKVTFAESFLYSTPGEGGVIQIGEADFLTAAIPKDAPQFSQLDFAQEALRDFNYNWAKIHLITEDENLILQLKLDGKPGHPLPFTYDGNTGNFRRLTQKTAQGMTRPIRLDVNFRFPLNTFLDYDKSVKELMEYVQ